MPPVWPGVCQEYSYSWVNFMSAAASGGSMISMYRRIAADHPPPDEGRGVLQGPDELVHHLHHVDGNRRGLAPLGHEEDGDLVVPGPDQLEQVAGGVVVAGPRPGSSR